jgi:hypothetical protein
MNEDNKEPEQAPGTTHEPDMSEEELRYDAEHRDWVLQTFVGLCNASGLEMPVTLNLAGSYVSGYVVKPSVYFDGIMADLQSATFHGSAGAEVKEGMLEIMASMKEVSTPVTDEKDDADERDDATADARPRYIHLRAARFYAPNDLARPFPSPPRGAWWRGKIASIDGFQIGMPFPA